MRDCSRPSRCGTGPLDLGGPETPPLIAPTSIATREPREPLSARGATEAKRRTLRCGIYSRVSTDEQAALEYNSLQAQEEICAGYVQMRGRDPGAECSWEVADTYRDSGYSGGTLERPALKQLLIDVEAGRIDTVVVYKIDRLSRSIHQFYRVWEVFEHRGIGLVSATQDLNTTTSQGKLMLNMLLSFGQFEREQIGERTRDKIRAARQRGKWTGGTPILGYDPQDGRLVVNEEEAARVRAIYSLYEEHRSLTRVIQEVTSRGWMAKSWTTAAGELRGGRQFDKTSLFRLLVNPLYAGKVRCGKSLVPGEQEAIVPEATWSHARTRLRRNGTGYQSERGRCDAILQGLLRCAACGRAMTPTYALKGARRYRYYVCQTALKKGAHACPHGKVAAKEVERQVVERIREIGRDSSLVAETVRQLRAQLEERRLELKTERRQLARELGHAKVAMRRLVSKSNGNGNSASAGAETASRIQAIETRLAAVDREAGAAADLKIDEVGIALALGTFGPVWESLWPPERMKLIGWLVEGIEYDRQEKRLGVRFRINVTGTPPADGVA